MRTIKAKPITQEAFAPYGCFTSVLNPSGPSLSGELHTFYREGSRFFHQGKLPVGFSPITVKNPERMVINCAEYHNTTCEAIIAVNDDFILHVAPANGGTPEPEKTEAFIVPKGDIVTLYPGVWHLCPLPKSEPVLHALIILPERTYINDFFIENFKEGESFEIVV